MRLRHYFHVYAVGHAESVVVYHLAKLKASGLLDELEGNAIYLGVIGAPEARRRIIDLCNAIANTVVIAARDEGFEQATLDAMYDIECFGEGVTKSDRAVFYAHTKGVSERSALNESWRESMGRCLIDGWRESVSALEGGYQAAGCHWLTADMYPDLITAPFFGGNWWWVRADAMAFAPRCARETRYDAEAWLGRSGVIRVYDFTPGWPGFVNFRRAE